MTLGGVLRSCRLLEAQGRTSWQSAVVGLGGDYKDGLLVIILQPYVYFVGFSVFVLCLPI